MASRYPRVRVRMYRQGLGDCFLLTIQAGPRRETHLLIDCGVFLGTSGASETMRAVAADIKTRTRGHINVVVATHEHYDHLSGFNLAREVFDEIDFGEVWMAWTEDENDELALRLGEERRQQLRALDESVAHMRALGFDAAYTEQLESLLQFYGPLSVVGRRTIAEAIEYLKYRGANNTRYLHPGQAPISLPGIPQARFFVLGPPRDRVLLRRSAPSRQKETYFGEGGPPAEAESSEPLAAMLGQRAASTLNERDFPFNRGFKLTKEEMPEHLRALYNEEDALWRRIDRDWLRGTEELALRLDEHTNNTSLVLALELVGSGKVLLFAGDAQVGNWLSWESLAWELTGPDGCANKIDAHDLLRRVVFYKVGHHGSHNATLREKGLELMESDELVAMIPVEQSMADRKKWKMPFDALWEALSRKTRGRLIRADHGLAERSAAPEEYQLDSRSWNAFRRRLKDTPLYLELLVH
jgi:hypothetical protein